MLEKSQLKKEFASDWKRKYQVALFDHRGFERRTCQCGNNFWTLDPDRTTCGNPPCDDYGFLKKPITKKKWDYVQTWKEFEKFFVKEGHTSVPRYPVVDRWRPDLYFTIASIQDFQRLDKGKMVFEYPANPLVVPQVCLRFPDIPNVGITGRHSTSFIMPGQHAFGHPKEGYFKDRCIDLNFAFLNGVMGIPEEELVYVEDVWAMPDFSAFGPSIECVSRGLELVNHVFMEFTKQGNGYKELDMKVNDTGWGHERLVWFSNGGPTSYDVIFEPVVKWMKQQSGVAESDLFHRYATLAGGLDFEDRNVENIKKVIAGKLGVTVQEIDQDVAPLQGLYAIADHTKTLLFAITDGAIPSNVGGGYNLRVILRRALSFLNDHGFSFDMVDVAERHAKQLKKLFPELKDGLDLYPTVMDVEGKRYEATMSKAKGIVVKYAQKGITEKDLLTLYSSHGVAPELVRKLAKGVKIPEDFYDKVLAQHMGGKKEKEVYDRDLAVDLTAYPPTDTLYYKDPYQKEMDATVLGTVKNKDGTWLILDQTVFYPEGGGQPADRGTLTSNGKTIEVSDVQKVGTVVLHNVSQPLAKGQDVHGVIDWDRRNVLIKMHDATHIVAGACRKILGRGAWQAGAQKGTQVSRLDITHYQPFSREDLTAIERVANDIVKKNVPITATVLPRGEAENTYGFVLYQGGASPGKEVRVVEVQGHDIEACGGTHGTASGNVGTIKIVKSERIQDGVNRLTFTAGEATDRYNEQMETVYDQIVHTLGNYQITPQDKDHLAALEETAHLFSVDVKQLPGTLTKFFVQVDASRISGTTLPEIGRSLFQVWKTSKKEQEHQEQERAASTAEELLKKTRNNRVFDIIAGERKELIQVAELILEKNPDLTVILANQGGDVIGMSNTQDMGNEIKTLAQQAGGTGGGKGRLGQGRVQLSKLIKLMR